jgi:nicotinate phosphoribosyltransferase
MSIFDQQRLTNQAFKLDIERMRRGWYSDKYFVNITTMLSALTQQGYSYSGKSPRLAPGVLPEIVMAGDLEVEMQWFTRRPGETLVVGIDKSLAMLRHCTGYWEGDHFVDTSDRLEVWAVQDGCKVSGEGDPLDVRPVMKVRGRYRDFAILETPTLGNLTRASRVATNVYETFVAARGKPVMFFPARFDVHEVQAADGYAYSMAVQRYNLDHASSLGPFISTDAQGDWWGGYGGGTVAHAAIACFLGDTAEAMLAFSRVLPVTIPRIALVDFNNDCVADSLDVCQAMFARYRDLVDAGDLEEAARYKLFGVRLDTSANLRDVSVLPLGDPQLDLGVTPRLVFNVRQALDAASDIWDVPQSWRQRARDYCREVKIVVSGGFNPEKIRRFERLSVPVDIYAVGSSLFDNHGPTVTDFTADVVRVKIDGQWVDMAKIGRSPLDNPDLGRVW